MSTQNEDGWWVRTSPDGTHDFSTPLATTFAEEGVTNVQQIFAHVSTKYSDKPCYGTRKLISRERKTSNGKTIEKLEMGEYEWVTYAEAHTMAMNIAKSLRTMGYAKGDRIALFAETRAEWLTAASAIWQQEAVLCTVYTTLNDDGIVHTMNETEVPIVFTTSDLYPRIIKLLSKCPKIESIVVMEDQIEPIEINTSVNAKTISFKSLIEDDDNSEDSPTPTANPDDIAMIMYTSGSTGIPKGVELSHRNLMNFMTGFSYQIPVDDDTRYLAFLPLAHCFELACELSLVAKGSPIYYSSPTTITASSPRIMEGTLGDAMLAKPTLMSAVPLVLDKIIKNVLNKVRQMGWLKSYLFETILANKTLVDYIPIFGYALDTIFFTKVRTELGGCLRHLISGGAPISIQTQATFGALFGCKLFVGYGSTENFAYVSVSKLEDHRLGHVGPPNFGVMVKLEDWEEGNYRSTDKPNPRGEIIITGPGISRGYFKKPKETAETFFTDSQGKHCFKSGDIGEIDEYGCIKIIDRKKDLVKLKHGEYVALGYIESIIKTLPSIDTCCAYADSNKENLILLVVPNPDMILQIYREENPDKNFNISENAQEKFDIKDMYQDEALNQKVLSLLQTHCLQSQLNKWEVPAAIHLTTDTWDPDSDLVTSAFKLRRKPIQARYQEQIGAMYEQLNATNS